MKQELQEKLDKMKELVEHMDVPSIYHDRIPWLSKHLAERNSGHKDFAEAKRLIDELMKAGVR